MFFKLVILLFVVCLANCKTKETAEDPPWAEALKAKYFGHIGKKKKDLQDIPPYGEALNNEYFGHIRGKRTNGQATLFDPQMNKLEGWEINPEVLQALNDQFFGHIRGKRWGGWGRNGDLQNALNNAYMGHIRGKRDQTQSTKKSE